MGIALAAAVVDLQEKGVVELAPSSLGYCSRLFVTPKVTGVASCDRSLAPQLFCGCISFPYGELSVDASIHSVQGNGWYF